jgi:general secretion pathway protein K
MRQRGAAILTAMVTVTLVATLAAAALWQQWRQVEVESAERTRVQLAWVLTGALDWARLILREDARTSQVDHLSEPWALPLAEARLSSFLAVDQNNTDDAMDAFLSGQVTDQQGLLNVADLVEDGQPSAVTLAAFARLFRLLQLPLSQLDALVANLVRVSAAQAEGAAGALMPTRMQQLTWLGLPQSSVQALDAYATLLPLRTPVNLNTAPALVLVAVLPGLDLRQAQTLVAQRALAHYPSVAQALKAANVRADQVNAARFSVASRYFTVRGRLRIGDTVVQELSLVEREGTSVKVLWRQREPVPNSALQNNVAQLRGTQAGASLQ